MMAKAQAGTSGHPSRASTLRTIYRVLRWIVLGLLSIFAALSLVYAGWFFTRNWSSMAEREISAFYDNVLAHHPGPVDAGIGDEGSSDHVL